MKKVRQLKRVSVPTLKKKVETAPVYDNRWRKVSREYRDRHTYCVKCWEKGVLTTEATSVLHVDHIIPVKDRPDLQYDESNFMCLCINCHTEKTLAENPQCLGGQKESRWFFDPPASGSRKG
ncbi:HNH endonuclease signature motif containing protein [Gluconobacter sp. DsW_056]|uniref:HNH endonuclease signature motif containing protein n=1 Tax=Gluconobacter sp. DsW_056 TaxID=1511209 RepID=UPI000A3ADA6C